MPEFCRDAYGNVGEKFVCMTCDGSGVDWAETCLQCGGLGYVADYVCEDDREAFEAWLEKEDE